MWLFQIEKCAELYFIFYIVNGTNYNVSAHALQWKGEKQLGDRGFFRMYSYTRVPQLFWETYLNIFLVGHNTRKWAPIDIDFNLRNMFPTIHKLNREKWWLPTSARFEMNRRPRVWSCGPAVCWCRCCEQSVPCWRWD